MWSMKMKWCFVVRNRSNPKWANNGHRFYTQWRLLSSVVKRITVAVSM